MTKFVKSQYFEDKSASKYSVFCLATVFSKRSRRKLNLSGTQQFFFVKVCVSHFIQFLIVKPLSLLSIETLVYPNNFL